MTDTLERIKPASAPLDHMVERFEDVVTHPLYATSVVENARIGSWSTGFSKMKLQPGHMDNLTVGYSALAVYRAPTRIQLTVSGEVRDPRNYLPGELVLRPRGLNYESRYFKTTDVNVLALETDRYRNITDKQTEDVEDVFSAITCKPFLSPVISSLMDRIDQSVFAAEQPDPLFLDAALQTICLEIWHAIHGTFAEQCVADGKLGACQLRKVDECIHDLGPNKLDMHALANELGVPPSKLRSLFKASFDQSLYQYVLNKRIDRARQMIETTNLALAEVAYQCGFSSQSHMTDQFSAKLSVTPGKLRGLQMK